MRRVLLNTLLVGLVLAAATNAEPERFSRRLQQPVVTVDPATPPPAAAVKSPAAAKPKVAPKAPACTLLTGPLINTTTVKEPVTTCAAEAALQNATITTPVPGASKVNTTSINGKATRCTVKNGTVVAKSCAPANALVVKSPPAPSPLPSPIPSPIPSPTPGKKKSSSVGPAVGGAIGGIAALAAIAALVWFFVIKPKRKQPAAPYTAKPKEPFRGTPDAAVYRDQNNGRPTTFVVGKDPAMLSRRHEDLRQAIQSFESRFQPATPPAFWQRLVGQAPALEAAVDAAPLGPYLLRHHIWRWFDTKIWADGAPMAKPPVFPRGRATAGYDAALTELKTNPETYQQFSSQVARELAEDLRLPQEGQATYEKDLQYLVECAVELRLAVGVVDPNAAILVAPVDPSASPLQLRAAGNSQQVFRSLAIDASARTRVTPGVALCHVPGIGHRTRSYTYEQEQVISATR